MKRVNWDRIRVMTKQNYSAAEIAHELNCSTRTVTRVRRKLGISLADPEASQPIAAEIVERIGQMIEDGCSHKEIARTLNISSKTVKHYFPGTEWGIEQQREFQRIVMFERWLKEKS